MNAKGKNNPNTGKPQPMKLDGGSWWKYGKPVEDAEQKGSYYKVSNVLLDTYTKAHRTEVSDTKATTEIQCTDANDKPTFITPYQMKILLHFLPDVAKLSNDEEVRTGYIANLPEKVRFGQIRKTQKQVETPTIYKNMTKFAKEYYGTSRVGTKNIDNLYNELVNMSKTRIKFTVKSREHGKTIEREFTASLIGNVQTYKEAENGKRTKNDVLLTVSDAMLYGLNQAGLFQIAPKVLTQLISIANNNTEIFLKLLFQLVSVRGYRVNHANAKEKATRKELQDEGVTDAATIEKAVAAARTLELTYEEMRSTILRRLDGNTYDAKVGGKVYVKKSKLDRDLKRAADDLRDHIRIIKNYKIVTTADGDKKFVCVLTANWAEEAEKYLAQRAKK